MNNKIINNNNQYRRWEGNKSTFCCVSVAVDVVVFWLFADIWKRLLLNRCSAMDVLVNNLMNKKNDVTIRADAIRPSYEKGKRNFKKGESYCPSSSINKSDWLFISDK